MSEKWVQLVDRVLDLTNAGKLEWQETSDSDIYQVVLGKNVLDFESEMFGNGYSFKLRGPHGNIVESFSANELTDISNKNYFDASQKLVTLIERQISGKDQLLDEVIAELDKFRDKF
ncbi:hypothetical protein [uncultured Tateyamaria sp.]|uniref:hypothetical protein n=1 Tax=uncultured Tateyamaria sp. TaxID=455651 RepID=UPI0026214F90|nr:hypothetical protein [uncultured Tateyamaria sp.]